MSENAIPKIEGHAAFHAHLRAGRIEEAQVIGLENDRFVEKILFGRKYYEAPVITSRICGICPVIHNVTSVRAIEDACNITPSGQTVKLRKLMLCGQMIQSHSLHLYLLVLPDFVGASSSFELQKNHPDIFKNAIMLKQYSDMIVEAIGGRSVHPVSNVPGGFKSFPSIKKLKNILEESKAIEEMALKTVEMFANFEYPKVSRKIIYSAMKHEKDYAYYEGNIETSNDHQFKSKNYKHFIYEEVKHYTRAKFGTLRGHVMTVGAAARMNVNKEKMGKTIDELIKRLEIKNYFNNPFDNIVAQAIENYFFVLESQKIINHFIKSGIDEKDPIKIPVKFGTGTASCEAPRGTLFHHYKLDKNGFIIGCDIVTPTVQSLPAMEYDMKKLNPIIKDKTPSERTKIIEMLIRAYDPCITCATH